MASNRPAEVFPPGEFVREELEARGWTQADLAGIISRPLQIVNLIITGKKTITARTATELAAAFGTSPELWLSLQASYSLSQEDARCGDIEARARLYQIVPVKAMEARAWIKKTSTIEALRAELRRFYGTDNLDSLPGLPIAARSNAPSTQEASSAQLAWGYRVRELGKSLHVAVLDKRKVRAGLADLRALAANPEGVRKVPRVLGEMGIRFVVVEHLPRSRMDGGSLALGDSAVIGMSLRYNRIDSFWHTLLHEISHVLNDEPMLDVDIEESVIEDASKASVESRADQDAANMLIPRDKLDSFIARVGPLYSKDRINQFANRLSVHPGIIVGQLQHRKEIPYSANREMLVPVREILIQEALTDGWGRMVPQPQGEEHDVSQKDGN